MGNQQNLSNMYYFLQSNMVYTVSQTVGREPFVGHRNIFMGPFIIIFKTKHSQKSWISWFFFHEIKRNPMIFFTNFMKK